MPPSTHRASNPQSMPRVSTVLPPYQPSTSALTQAALLSLHSLQQSHTLASLTKRQNTAYTHLSDLAGEINDRHQNRAGSHAKKRALRAAQGQSDDEEAEQKIAKIKESTENVTTKMEAAVRKVVDERMRVEAMENALRELDTNLREGSGRVAATQSTLGASQFRSQQRARRGANISSEDSEDSESESAPKEGPTGLLKRKLEGADTEYENLSKTEKYSSNNDYVAFRKILHDALHPGDDAPPLPHASTWFKDSKTTATTNNAATASDDEDVQIHREKRSTRCPLTLRPMRDPVSSTKCPHSFEKSAIDDMLSASEMRIPSSTQEPEVTQGRRTGPQGEKAMRCPECQVLLTASALLPDPALARKIKRMLAKEAQGEESEDEDAEVRAPVRERQRVAARVKAEKGAIASGRAVSMVPNSQVRDASEGEEAGGETQFSVNDDDDDDDDDEE